MCGKKRDPGVGSEAVPPHPVLRKPPKDSSRFVVAGQGWRLGKEEKLAAADRPNPAYKKIFHTGGATYWLDPRGHRVDYPDAAAVLRVTDREGNVTAERGLAYDTHRTDVNTDGSGILFLSRDGVLHGYSQQLQSILTDRLEDIPEYQAQAERLAIDPHELKNHVRCVAIGPDRSWYLITVVDEAWCLSTANGEVRWGLRFPIQDGWRRVASPRTDRIGTSREVEAALKLMKLSFRSPPKKSRASTDFLRCGGIPTAIPGIPPQRPVFKSSVQRWISSWGSI